MKRGYFGIGVYHPKTEENIGTLWRSANLFGASFIFTIGKRYKKQPSDTCKTYRSIPLMNFLTFEDFYEHIPYDSRLICIELNEKSSPLNTFVHYKRAIYLLGAEDYGIPGNILANHITVQIPTIKPLSLNVATAGSIVMYDRIIKLT